MIKKGFISLGKVCNKKNLGLMIISIFLIQSFSVLGINSTNNLFSDINSDVEPRNSDVSGLEFYAEQIGATIAGNNSLITQSFFTNDTNVFSRVDFSDPAFVDAAFVLSISNNQKSNMYPMPITSNIGEQMDFRDGIPAGFIFYGNNSDYEMVQTRLRRALGILKETFRLDFIITNKFENSEIGYLYNFVADYPCCETWKNYLEVITSNIPKDGYWDAFDIYRLVSDEYFNNKLLRTNLVYVSSFDFLISGMANISSDDINVGFDLSIIDTLNTFTDIFNLDNPMFDELLDTSDFLGDFDEIFENFLNELTNVVLCSIEYEGVEQAIEYDNESNSYTFDLFKAMNYTNSNLEVTPKSFNSIMGALLSGIHLSMYSAEPIEMNPTRLFLSDYNLNRIEELLFLIGGSDTLGFDIDIDEIRDYSFKVGWNSFGNTLRLVTYPENLNDRNDPINLLDTLGIGVPIIMGAILNPIEEFQLKYVLLDNEPYLEITKTVENASRMLVNNPNMTITVNNPTTQDVWGQKIDTRDISTLLYLLSEGIIDIQISNDPTDSSNVINNIPGINNVDALFEGIEAQGIDISEYFKDDDPRFILVDTYSTGFPDYFYPELDITNPYVIAPYSDTFVEEVLLDPEIIGNLPFDLQLTATALVTLNALDNPASIFNPENWILEAGSNFTYTVPSLNLTVLDNYSVLKNGSLRVNSVDGISPLISYGELVGNSIIEATHENSNGMYWSIESEEINEENIAQFYSLFKNQTTIEDYNNNSLDGLNLELIFNSNLDLINGEIIFEMFNYSAENFEIIEELDFNSIMNTNDGIINFTISNLDLNIANFFNVENNMSILLRTTFHEFDNDFILSFDSIQLSLLKRVNVMTTQLPARVMYQSELGIAQYSTRSNSISIGSYDTSSIMGIAQLNNYESYCGEIVNYNITLHNLGNREAKNVSITIMQPGIIPNLNNIQSFEKNGIMRMNASAGNFTLERNVLVFNIESIPKFSKIDNISFNFIVPNSREIPDAIITWYDNESEEVDQIEHLSLANQLRISAPIKYFDKTNTPFVHELLVEYTTNFLEPGTQAPTTDGNPEFEVELLFKNIGENTVYDIHYLAPLEIDGLIYNNESEQIWIEQLAPGEEKTISLSYNKTNFRGYLIPIPVITSSMESSFIITNTGNPILLGSFNLNIEKTFETLYGTMGEEFKVTVNVTNLGTLELGNFTIDDSFSYPAVGFRIKEGRTVIYISKLNPDQSIIIEYILVIRGKGVFTMRQASSDYYYRYKQTVLSNQEIFLAREPHAIRTARIYLPIFLGLISIGASYRYKTKYYREDMEFERREKLLFGTNLRDSSWHKRTLEEFLKTEEGKNYE